MASENERARAAMLASRITVAIITALPNEFAAIESMLDEPVEYSMPGKVPGEYVLGETPSKDGGTHAVVAVCSSMGENLAAARVTLLLERFPKIESVLMVGIAGAVPDPMRPGRDVHLGDVVVSDSNGIKQYDFDKETLTGGVIKKEPRFPPRPPGARLLDAAAELERLELGGKRPLETCFKRVSKLRWARRPTEPDELHTTDHPENIVTRQKDPRRRKGKPRIFHGAIASANKLLKNARLRDELRDLYGVMAVEMEAAGVADAAWLANTGYLVVRGTCDYCDEYKSDSWQRYAAIIAAAYGRALLERMRSADPGPSRSREPPKTAGSGLHASLHGGVLVPPNEEQSSASEGTSESDFGLEDTHILRAVFDEQRYLLNRFVGRTDWLARLSKGDGYKLLVGAPGSGKSALLAKLQERCEGASILHMIKNGREPYVFLLSLLAQASALGRRHGLAPLPPAAYKARSVEILVTRLMDRLREIGERSNTIISCLIDGLDELPSGVNLTFLPTSLPRGVRVVLSSRPDVPTLSTLRLQLSHITEHTLESGLTSVEIRDVIRQVFQTSGFPIALADQVDVASIERRTHGTPLYVKYISDELAAQAAETMKRGLEPNFRLTIPIGEHAWHSALLQRLTSHSTGEKVTNPKVIQRMLRHLAVMHGRAAVAPAEILGVLRASDAAVDYEDVRMHLSRLAPILVTDSSGAVTLFHKRLAEHILEADGAEAVVKWHRWASDWLTRNEAQKKNELAWSSYHLAHALWHLCSGGFIAEATGLFMRFGYLMARLMRFGPTEAAALLSDVVLLEERWSIDPAAVRTEAVETAHLLRSHSHVILESGASAALQAAVAHGRHTPITQAAEEWVRTASPTFPWLRRINAPEEGTLYPCSATLVGHQRTVASIAIHPDGKHILTSGDFDKVRLWNIDTGACIRTFRIKPSFMGHVAFHPDGQRFLVGSDLGICVVDLHSGDILQIMGDGDSKFVLTSDGCGCLSVERSAKSTILSLWDVETGALLKAFGEGEGRITDIQIPADTGQVVCTRAGRIEFWSLSTGALMSDIDIGEHACCFALHPDRRRILLGTVRAEFLVYDIATGRCLHNVSKKPDGIYLLANDVRAVAIDPTGRFGVCGYAYDHTVKIWDLDSGRCLSTLWGHADVVDELCVHPDGRIASGSWDHTVKIWSPKTALKASTLSSLSPVWAMATDAQSSCFVAGHHDGLLTLWDMRTGVQVGQLSEAQGSVTSVACLGGDRAVSVHQDSSIHLWNLRNRTCVRKDAAGGASLVCRHPDPQRFILARGGYIEIWDIETWEVIQRLQLYEGRRITHFQVSADGRTLLAGFSEKPHMLAIVDLATRRVWTREAYGVSIDVTAVGVTSDGRYGIANLGRWDYNLINITTNTVYEFSHNAMHTDFVVGFEFSPDGRWLVSASRDRSIRIWDGHELERLQLIKVLEWPSPVSIRACCTLFTEGKFHIAYGDILGDVGVLVLENANAGADPRERRPSYSNT